MDAYFDVESLLIAIHIAGVLHLVIVVLFILSVLSIFAVILMGKSKLVT